MNPIVCPVCYKTIKKPTEWNMKMHNDLSIRHKQYLDLKK